MDNIYNLYFMYNNWFIRKIFFVIVCARQKVGGNKTSTNSLIALVNYHYRGENRLIFW